ncbi:MAG: 23S rRNA (pseudouridine(1915)-N(3))-methyltransferase RlmH [Bryobacterales bacterium]|nr:23S rRNA (pseudouridine(1915)-N(3))-methyltransferase RlmH [Bryobacterales bacterium]
MKVLLYYVGKPRDPNANRMSEEFIQRATRFARCEMREIDPARFDPWAKHPTAIKVLLDPAGGTMDSVQFAKLLSKAEQDARDLVFLIGGATGLPGVWRERNGRLLSLSAMTFSHELARVVLAEQIYRAFTLLRGHPYPK